MTARWQRIATRIDALANRERVLGALAVALLLTLFCFQGIIDPMQRERSRLQARIVAWQAESSDNELQLAALIEAAQRDPDEAVRRRLAATNEQVAALEAEIRELAGQLVPPREVPGILRRVLEQTAGLDFVALEGLGAEPLAAAAPAGEGAVESVPEDATIAWRHGFRVSFRGSYLDTLAYLRALEALPWRFFWGGLELEVEAHPEALSSIEIYTLSLERSWIGV